MVPAGDSPVLLGLESHGKKGEDKVKAEALPLSSM